MRKIILLIISFFILPTFANSPILNIYGWADYLPPKVIEKFQKETGIRINFSTFDNNQILYAKLKTNFNQSFSNYDIIIPSTYMLQRMIHEKLLQKIDHAKIQNLKFLDTKLLSQSFDPSNQYSVPYLWGTTGILIDCKHINKNSVQHWHDLWNPRFRNQLILLDDMRDVFSIGLKVLGYPINDRNPHHIYQAYLKLKQLMPNVRSFVPNGTLSVYINKEAMIGMAANGDAYKVMQNAPNFCYIYPKEGANIWLDSLAISKNAQHVQNAYRFINFILRPEVAKAISEHAGFSTPNHRALKLMSKQLRTNRVFNPQKEDLQNVQTEEMLGNKVDRLYLQYWEKLKSS